MEANLRQSFVRNKKVPIFYVKDVRESLAYVSLEFYNIKINKLGHTPQTSNEGIIAPGILTLLSAILCFGLADKIYI